jgi:hypothetical protein
MDIHRARIGEPRRRETGYCVEGPGFYVWDEDPHEVWRLARDLARGARVSPPAPPRPREGGDSEA